MKSSSCGVALITGGAGFIGTNLADRLLQEGWQVTLYDDLSRAGVERNVDWLKQRYGASVSLVRADVRDREALSRCMGSLDGQQHAAVFHLAAQVAVTTSLADPYLDGAVNIGGTLNVLEALRHLENPPPLIFTSTNKVYGALSGLALRKRGPLYEPVDARIAGQGIAEDQPLDFHSPYGCSKGAADQYVLDYARSFGLHSTVFRMSCIYGPHQCGTEDQGWVAHFLRQVQAGNPITLYGDGSQVRDILFVQDLVDAFLAAVAALSAGSAADRRRVAGRAFNIGGGPERAVSLLNLLGLVEELSGRANHLLFADWRQGDQRWYVSNTARFQAATGWQPRVSVREGITRLLAWLDLQRSDAPGEALNLTALGGRFARQSQGIVWESGSLEDGSVVKEPAGDASRAPARLREGRAV